MPERELWGPQMRVWDLETGRSEAVLEGHGAMIFSLAVAPPAAGAASSPQRILKEEDGDEGDGDEDGDGDGDAWAGAALLSGSQDATVKVWPWPSGRAGRWRCARTLRGHAAAVLAVVALPPAGDGTGGPLAASGSVDHSIKVWEVRTGRLLRTLAGHAQPVDALCSSPPATAGTAAGAGGGAGGGVWWLFSTSTDLTLRVWSTQTWECVRVVAAAAGRPEQLVYRLALGGPQLVGGTVSLSRDAGAAYAVRVWDVDALVTGGLGSDSDEAGAGGGGGWRVEQPAGRMVYGVAAAGGQVWACVGEEVVVWGSGPGPGAGVAGGAAGGV